MAATAVSEVDEVIELVRVAEPVTFVRPSLAWFLVLDGGVAALGVLAFNRSAYEQVREVAPLPEQRQLQALFAGTVALHVFEATVARRMARRRGIPSGRWTRQTFVVGFPSLLKLRKIPAAPAS